MSLFNGWNLDENLGVLVCLLWYSCHSQRKPGQPVNRQRRIGVSLRRQTADRRSGCNFRGALTVGVL